MERRTKLADIAKKAVKHLHEEVDGLQIAQLIVIGVDADAEEEASVTAVDDFEVVPEFNEVGLVFLVAWGDKAVDFAFEFLLFVVVVGAVPFG